MLKWALILFLVSVVSGYLGFYRTSAATGTLAKLLFGVFLVLAVVVVIVALVVGQFVF
jgi:uncharacterized membrane protein YtjA (UPF0391 family)